MLQLLPFLFFLFVHLSSTLPTPPPLPFPPLPSTRQLLFHRTDLALFLHFGPNTFTSSEWGTGAVPPSVFNPSSLNATQWAAAAAETGFGRVLLTAKHHDGFCLWPSEYTNYSVESSPWRGGRGDVVRELAEAARKVGVGFGVYLSPWDRHEKAYGESEKYNEYYLGQMAELLTRYGDIKEVFLDGAPGRSQTKTEYFFKCWFEFIHQLQPGAVIFSDVGPDVRWVGTETGIANSTCWSQFNQSLTMMGNTTYEYSGGGDPKGREWIPPECDVSIRNGWFWHKDEHPKSAIELLDLYYKSVGRNCPLLLNVPPNSSGLISEEDLQVLREFAKLRKSIFSVNLGEDAIVSASSVRGGVSDPSFQPSRILQEEIHQYWAPDENQLSWELHLDLQQPISFNVLQIQEPIQMGQRISKFHVDVLLRGEWQTVFNGTTIGYKRLLQFPTIETQYLKLIIEESRADPLISNFAIHLDEYSGLRHDLDAEMKFSNSKSHKSKAVI